MTIKENNNFKSVMVYNVNEKMLRNSGKSIHMGDRKRRMNVIHGIEEKPVINKCFLVDKGHRDGQELHVVTERGIIYVYNFMKLFMRSNNALVTVMVARPNQIRRLYEACGLLVDDGIMNAARLHTKMKLNYA